MWAIYCDNRGPRLRYVARPEGRVLSVGADGFRYRLERPAHDGGLVGKSSHDAQLFTSRERAEAWIEDRGGGPYGAMGGGMSGVPGNGRAPTR